MSGDEHVQLTSLLAVGVPTLVLSFEGFLGGPILFKSFVRGPILFGGLLRGAGPYPFLRPSEGFLSFLGLLRGSRPLLRHL